MEVGYLGYWALDINFLDAVYGLSMPDSNLLPTELYNASNIAIVGGLFATWYFADDFANAASIMVWNSTHVYITENQIVSLGIGLLIYNPPYQVANITIYQNEFLGLNYFEFYGATSSINQELAFDSSFDNGVAQKSAGEDLEKVIIELAKQRVKRAFSIYYVWVRYGSISRLRQSCQLGIGVCDDRSVYSHAYILNHYNVGRSRVGKYSGYRIIVIVQYLEHITRRRQNKFIRRGPTIHQVKRCK